MSSPTPQVDVLLVDDDIDLRGMLREVLDDAGYVVVEVGSGAEAAQYLATSPAPRLILLDNTMPVMNGEEFRAMQKGIPAWDAIPTVSMTAAGEATRLAAFGTMPFIAKPFSPKQLLDTVLQHLK